MGGPRAGGQAKPLHVNYSAIRPIFLAASLTADTYSHLFRAARWRAWPFGYWSCAPSHWFKASTDLRDGDKVLAR
jgi:hypothetical protein